jgi:hypothetical protein
MRSIGPRRACDRGQMSGREAHTIAGQHTVLVRGLPGLPCTLNPRASGLRRLCGEVWWDNPKERIVSHKGDDCLSCEPLGCELGTITVFGQLQSPSDDLYNYMTISGVLLALASLYLTFTWFRDYQSAILTARSEMDVLVLRVDRVQRRIGEIQKKQEIDKDFFDCVEASRPAQGREEALLQCSKKFDLALEGVRQRYDEVNTLRKVIKDAQVDLEDKMVLSNAKGREIAQYTDALKKGSIVLYGS